MINVWKYETNALLLSQLIKEILIIQLHIIIIIIFLTNNSVGIDDIVYTLYNDNKGLPNTVSLFFIPLIRIVINNK